MAEYTQVMQRMRVATVLDDDELLLERLSGEEGISVPFLFELDLLSEDREVDGEALLRSGMAVEIDLPDGETRKIHGIVRRFVQKGYDRDLVSYRAEIVPWLWFLSLAHDCRIFQEMDVLDIVEEVFKGQGYSDFDIRCTRSYEKREYCVQYRESNLNFVSRLLEEEGIFYFFEHDESGHVLVLADDMTAVKECDGQPEARIHPEPVPEEDVVLELEREHSVHPGKVTLIDYDYLQPSLNLSSTVSGDEPEEVYDYPGSFRDLDAGDRNARLALEREEGRRQVVRGSSTCRGFRTGGRFRLLDHYRDDANQDYAILEIRHQAHNASYRGGRGAGDLDYRNEFIAIPHSVPYRPRLRARKPFVQGAHTAQVVGPSGEEIWVDKHGRVKVQFHWDRQGARDEGSSCWVRVSSPWAGKGWGYMQTPRIGHEVVVSFLEGDPDRPIVTGRVYNAENVPPLESPESTSQSIIRDHSGNEIVMEGKPGAEQIRMYSPFEDTKLVLGAPNAGNIFMTTGGIMLARIAGNVINEYGADFIEHVLRNEIKKVDGDTKWQMQGPFNKMTAGVEVTQNLSAKSTTTVGAEHSTFVGAKVSSSYSWERKVTRGWSKELVDNGKNIESKLHVKVEAATNITLTVGGAQIIISDDTIVIGAKKIILNGTNSVEVKSKKMSVNGTSQVELKGGSRKVTIASGGVHGL